MTHDMRGARNAPCPDCGQDWIGYPLPDGRVKCRDCGRVWTLDRWTVTEGRTLAFDGVPVLYISGLSDERRGLLYRPAELDTLTREIAAALNAAAVDGSKVPMR